MSTWDSSALGRLAPPRRTLPRRGPRADLSVPRESAAQGRRPTGDAQRSSCRAPATAARVVLLIDEGGTAWMTRTTHTAVQGAGSRPSGLRQAPPDRRAQGLRRERRDRAAAPAR